MRALAQPGGVAAPADVAEPELPLRMPGEGISLNVGRVKSLLGDAVAEKDDAVAVLNEELAGDCAGGQPRRGR